MKKRYHSVDIAKFVAAVLVAIIHCNPFKWVSSGLAYSVDIFAQLGVPVFFLFSAFFLFSKYDGQNFNGVLLAYVKRMGIMYCLWFIIMMPMTWELAFKGHDLLSFRTLRMFLFSSTFRGSWYLTASITAAVVISFLCKYISTKKVVVICIPIYVLCIMSSIYGKVFDDFIVLDVLVKLFGKITQTFLVALLYFSLGKLLAENRDKLHTYSTPGMAIMLVISLMLMFTEWLYAIDMGWNNGMQASVFIPITAFLLTIFILNWDVQSTALQKMSPYFRKASTITYFVHFIALYILRDVLGVGWHFIIRFLVIMAVCLLSTALIIMLEKKFSWKFLKYLS